MDEPFRNSLVSLLSMSSLVEYHSNKQEHNAGIEPWSRQNYCKNPETKPNQLGNCIDDICLSPLTSTVQYSSPKNTSYNRSIRVVEACKPIINLLRKQEDSKLVAIPPIGSSHFRTFDSKENSSSTVVIKRLSRALNRESTFDYNSSENPTIESSLRVIKRDDRSSAASDDRLRLPSISHSLERKKTPAKSRERGSFLSIVKNKQILDALTRPFESLQDGSEPSLKIVGQVLKSCPKLKPEETRRAVVVNSQASRFFALKKRI